jgi:hypothetical protein
MGYFVSAGFSMLSTIIVITTVAFTIYIYVLFIKLARRGIKALDLYIKERSSEPTDHRY